VLSSVSVIGAWESEPLQAARQSRAARDKYLKFIWFSKKLEKKAIMSNAALQCN
jgi:hypothetical protein